MKSTATAQFRDGLRSNGDAVLGTSKQRLGEALMREAKAWRGVARQRQSETRLSNGRAWLCGVLQGNGAALRSVDKQRAAKASRSNARQGLRAARLCKATASYSAVRHSKADNKKDRTKGAV